MDETQCLFCKIARGEIPSKKVYEDSSSFAFLDINPRNPGHALVIPKKHAVTIMDMDDASIAELAKAVRTVSIAVKNATGADGISIVQSNGPAAGQVVAHAHFHVIPRFLKEGPVSLEGILQVKKLDEESMDKIASAISEAVKGSGSAAEARKEKKENREISFDF